MMRIGNNKNEILLIWPSYPNGFWGYMTSGTFENDFAFLQALNDRNKPFSIKLGWRSISKVTKSKIFYNITSQFKDFPGKDYADSMQNWQNSMLERQNTLCPSYLDGLYWENKVYMHEQFEYLQIPCPKTYIVDGSRRPPNADSVQYPVLLKPAHASGSTGIIKINDHIEYDNCISETEHTDYLIQEWIDMRRDLRLIYIGDELVVHYWRINQKEEWAPTSTGHGSSVDFETLPDQWMNYIFQEYKKLNIKSGAFDITWRNDDLSTPPLFLEVSPSYMPNPAPIGKWEKQPYASFKKSVFGANAYYKKYIDLVFELKTKFLTLYN